LGRHGNSEVEVRRSPLIAAALNIVLFGAGHLYLGCAARFLWPAGAVLVIFFGLGAAGLLSTFVGMAIYLALLAALWLFAVGDAIFTGYRIKAYIPKWYSRWYVYLAWPLVYVVLFPVMNSIREPLLGYSAFRIANQAMSPALELRDVVLVDTRAFRTRLPAIGEIVVIRKPDTGRSYIRRVSARPTEDAIAVAPDQPTAVSSDTQLQSVPLAEVVGRVSYVMYSRDSSRIGQRLE
jgi:hypothetical protein